MFFQYKNFYEKGYSNKSCWRFGAFILAGNYMGHNGEIEYGPTAVDLLKNVLVDVVSYESGSKFEFKDRNRIIVRHISLLRRINSDIEDDKAKSVAEEIVKGKESLVHKLLS